MVSWPPRWVLEMSGVKRKAARPVLKRRSYQVVLVLYVVALVGAVGMVVGPFLNDRAIDAEPARAMATVRGESWMHTYVGFQDGSGIYHSPPTGLLYPTGLGVGQKVWVEYRASDPDLVRVEGRRWTLSIVPALSVVVVATVVAALLWWLVGRLRRGVKN